MLAQAGETLGHTFTFYDEALGEATTGIGRTIVGKFSDLEKLGQFARECDIITYEFENVPYESAQFLATIRPVYPPPPALEISQDRIREKAFVSGLGLSTPRFEPASTKEELIKACDTIGYPCIIKTRRLGYDGKGQARATTRESLEQIWEELGKAPLIVEALVPFSRELSIIGTRDTQGAMAIYPLAHNIHVRGILHRTEIPAPSLSPTTIENAHTIISTIMEALDYVGVLTVELFDIDGQLLINELAPRVHNSGHASIESIEASQFENHIRAITSMPLGSVKPIGRAVMYNIVGKLPPLQDIAALPQTNVHLYNKSERAGRKIGHITALNPTPEIEGAISRALPSH
jgi:5-(carboxyamino)imidazole ribonucleotide synthase